MAIKNLGWIALGGFAVGFVAFGGAFAAGGKDMWSLDNLPNWKFGYGWQDRCGKIDASERSERRLAWTGGETVGIAIPGNVRYKVGEGEEVVVRGPQNFLDHVVIEGDSIKLDCGGVRGANLDVTLPGIAFRKIDLAGSGDLVGENLNQEELKVSIAGRGSVRATGSAAHVEVNIAGSGDANLKDLAMKTLELNVAGSGDAEAAPVDSAKVNVIGSGNLKLFSNPKDIKTSIVGSGRVIHAGPKETGI